MANLLNRLLEPVAAALNTEAAHRLVTLRADAATQIKVRRLARKCNEGTLTANERSEYESFVRASTLIAVLQAQARRRLGTSNRQP